MWDQILTWAVVILPTFFALGIEVISKEIRQRPYWRVGVIAFGIGVSTLTWLQMSRANGQHAFETLRQHVDIENLRGDLHRSETERQVSEAYLKAKLEDSYQMNSQLAQLGPALMKLAQTSADFERKQYETKITSNKELYDFTLEVVKKIRGLSQKYATLQRQQTDEWFAITRQAQSDAERQRQWNEETQKEIHLRYDKDAEFRASMLSDALYARNELLKKGVPEPTFTPTHKSDVDMVLRGILAGANPELALADYLEIMAKQLPMK